MSPHYRGALPCVTWSDAPSPAAQAKLMKKHQSLQVPIPLWFFEQVATEP